MFQAFTSPVYHVLQAVTPDQVNAWFTPIAYILYLGSMLVGMTVYYQWKWTKVCRTKVLVLVKKADGHGDYDLADQDGGSVSLTNPNSNTIRTWPLTELATISVPYPGTGLVPQFLQKTIQMIMVEESDWEPLTNRSPHRQMVASPDVISELREIAALVDDESREKITDMIDQMRTAPTRELIASPGLLGNLIHEKISEAVLTVNKEMMDAIAGLTRKLTKLVSPTMLYVCTGILFAVIAVVLYFTVSNSGAGADKLDLLINGMHDIEKGIGIPLTIPTPTP